MAMSKFDYCHRWALHARLWALRLFGYQIAEQFGLNVIPPRASLVPFTWRESDKFYAALSGISLDVAATNQHKTFTHQMLFTHRGLSGPAILQISNYWQPGESIHLDLLPYNDIRHHLDEMRQSSPKLQLKTVLKSIITEEISRIFWLEQGLIQDEVIANLSKSAVRKFREFNPQLAIHT